MKSKLNEITKASHKYKIHIWKKRLKKILSFKTEWIIGLKNLSFGLNSENLQRFTFVLIEENEFFKRWKPVSVVPFYLSFKRKKKRKKYPSQAIEYSKTKTTIDHFCQK